MAAPPLLAISSPPPPWPPATRGSWPRPRTVSVRPASLGGGVALVPDEPPGGLHEAGERSRNRLQVERAHTLDPVVLVSCPTNNCANLLVRFAVGCVAPPRLVFGRCSLSCLADNKKSCAFWHSLWDRTLAVEWRHGRRRGRLSNLHLGARGPADGSLVTLGRTFKGLTDAVLMEQTELLQRLETARDRHTVRMEVVVACNDLRASPQYPVGMASPPRTATAPPMASPQYPGSPALRFARVIRCRPDKRAERADTLDSVRH